MGFVPSSQLRKEESLPKARQELSVGFGVPGQDLALKLGSGDWGPP